MTNTSTAPRQAGLVVVHSQDCLCPMCHRPACAEPGCVVVLAAGRLSDRCVRHTVYESATGQVVALCDPNDWS